MKRLNNNDVNLVLLYKKYKVSIFDDWLLYCLALFGSSTLNYNLYARKVNITVIKLKWLKFPLYLAVIEGCAKCDTCS